MNQIHQFPRVAVRAIIVNEKGQILILKRSDNQFQAGRWCLPGGKVDFGESAEEALIKEVAEETALNVTSHRFLFYQDNLPDETVPMHFISLYFECEVSGNLQINDESDEARWIGHAELSQFNLAFLNGEAVDKWYRESRDNL